MSDNQVQGYIQELFEEIDEATTKMIEKSPTTAMATQEIMKYVSSSITAAVEGYMVDIYSALSKATLQGPAFQEPANANKFYELNLRRQIADVCRFDIENREAYRQGIDYKERNLIYCTAGVAVGSAAVGGVLLKALSSAVKISTGAVLAGAILCGIGGAAVYSQVGPRKNKERQKTAVKVFLSNLKEELLRWVDEVEQFYIQKVEELKGTL
jgi:hypothetical protein